MRDELRLYGSFYGRPKFCCKRAQFCVTRCKCPNAELPSVSNAVQHSENVRNSLGLNYKSAALPAVLLAQVSSGPVTMARR
jgi:hypothetical protein